jgi:perosamine synthetase
MTATMVDRPIPLAVPYLHGNEQRYLEECIRTNWVSYVGPFVSRFEEEFATAVGAAHAVAVNSGTAALHIGLLALGVGPSDLVIVPDLTFIAPANAVRYCGADPVFVGVTKDTWQLDVSLVERFVRERCDTRDGITRHKTSGRRIAAIVPVHLLGHAVDMDPLVALAQRGGIAIVEDATESLGGTYRGRSVGTHGRVGCFSFNGNKIITSGGGGMATTDDAALAKRMRYLSTQARDDTKEYVHESVGFNYRLTNVQAAVGLAQLELLPEHVRAKRAIAARYADGLRGVPGVTLPAEASWASSTFWLYTILVEGPARRSSRELIADLAAERIEARPLWAPLHEQRPYRDAETYEVGTSRWLYERAVSLPSSVGLREADQSRVIDAVRRSLCGVPRVPTESQTPSV